MKRTRGLPASPNGASSFHLWWQPPTVYDRVEVTLEILEPPVVPRLYFWALQAGFLNDRGSTGAAHLGLQWHPGFPNRTAVNYGGYSQAGVELAGTESALPSALNNSNTRDYRWRPAVGYRLRIERGSRPGWWTGSVTEVASGATVKVRELEGGGDRLGSIVVWSEVFARCDDPSVVVRWSGPGGLAPDGDAVDPVEYLVTYQRETAGGCSNTDTRVTQSGVEQATNTPRLVTDRALIPISLQAAPG